MRALVVAAALLAGLVGPVAAAPQDLTKYISNAEERVRHGDSDGALGVLTGVLVLDPRNLDALRYRAFIRLQQLPPGPLDAAAVRSAQLALADLSLALEIDPGNGGNLAFRAALHARLGNPAAALVDATQAIARDRDLYLAHSVVMSIAWDRAYGDSSLTAAQKRDAIAQGSAAAGEMVRLQPADVTGLTYKGLFLRLQAAQETNLDTQRLLLQQADDYRRRAEAARTAAPPAPPPPPPQAPAGGAAVRIGGDIAPPTKLVDVRPAYPPIAQTARVQGAVIVEATIDPDGNVMAATILRSIPLLDQAALDAVYQWKFTPTLVNGIAVPVIMTVTVNFSLQ